jgi:hypothetical protein
MFRMVNLSGLADAKHNQICESFTSTTNCSMATQTEVSQTYFMKGKYQPTEILPKPTPIRWIEQ